MDVLAPGTVAALADVVRDARARHAKLEIRGGGSKAGTGAPRESTILDMRGFCGIVDYDPAELVLTVRAGTPLTQVQALLAANRQMLAFEPYDHGPIFGTAEGAATIGGVVAAGISGSRRLSAGAARDHLLGFTAVSGRGDIFVAGGKVVKNVTGFDLSKLMAGSWGRLAALTEISLKVLPAAPESATFLVRGLDATAAARVMARLLGSAVAPAALAYVPGEDARVMIRLEGFGPSVAARRAALASIADAVELSSPDVWDSLRRLEPFAADAPLWRITLPARQLPLLAERLDRLAAPWLADWGGGLVWATCPDAQALRAAAAEAGGHAILVRGPPALRRSVPAFHPLPPLNAMLEAQVVKAFDPDGVFETGRFGGSGHAD